MKPKTRSKSTKPRANNSGRLAALVLERHFAKGRHLIHLENRFWFYDDGGVWRKADDSWIAGRIADVLSDLDVTRSLSAAINDVLALLRAMQTPAANPFVDRPSHGPVANCRNGEVWLVDRRYELRPHSPTSYLMHQMPVVYDHRAKCPLYGKAVSAIFSKTTDPKGTRRHWHEVGGYTLQEGRQFAMVPILLGAGSNGKTLLTKILIELLGRDLVYAARVEELRDDKWAIGHLAGKRLFIDDDVEQGIVLPDAILKKISEPKVLTGEWKFENKAEFESRVVPMLVCNHLPELRDTSDGMLRRFQVIPFDRKFAGHEDDPTLLARICQRELPGVLNRMLAGYRRLQARGRFNIPEPVRAATKAWVAKASPVKRFVEECCAIGDGQKQLGDSLYRAFLIFAREDGIKSVPERRDFYRALSQHGFAQKKGNQGQRFVGVALNQWWGKRACSG